MDIYDKYAAAFRNVSAYAILRDGKHVANITMKHGNAVTAYVHWLGLEMQFGMAGGGGYDKASAACAAAARKLALGLDASTGTRVDPRHDYNDFRRALAKNNGAGWARELENAGFTICNVIT